MSCAIRQNLYWNTTNKYKYFLTDVLWSQITTHYTYGPRAAAMNEDIAGKNLYNHDVIMEVLRTKRIKIYRG